MKFLKKLDVNTFLAEVQSFDKIGTVGKDYAPTNEEMKTFIKARTPLVKKLKSGKQSSSGKANWRKNRTKMMKGIKAFHRSVDGKRFHRRLGRFLSTRLLRKADTNIKPKTQKASVKNEDVYEALLVKQAFLKGLNAAKQHLFIEMDYFHQLEEQVDLELFITEHAIPMFRSIELKILEDSEITEDEVCFLFDVLSEKIVLKALAEKLGKEFAEIEKLWNSISTGLKKKGITSLSENYFDSLLPLFFKKLGLKYA